MLKYITIKLQKNINPKKSNNITLQVLLQNMVIIAMDNKIVIQEITDTW